MGHLVSKINRFLFLRSNSKTKIENVILSLDSNKSVGPKSIPTKTLKLLKINISSQLFDISNSRITYLSVPYNSVLDRHIQQFLFLNNVIISLTEKIRKI